MLDVSSDQLADACHSARFVSLLANKGPFEDLTALQDAARYVWWHEVRQLCTRSQHGICALSEACACEAWDNSGITLIELDYVRIRRESQTG